MITNTAEAKTAGASDRDACDGRCDDDDEDDYEEVDKMPAVMIVGGFASALMLAVVGTGAMLITYIIYYQLVEKPEQEEEDNNGGMGGYGGGGSGESAGSASSGSSNAVPAPPPSPAIWQPTTLWSYFLIKMCVPVFASFLTMALLTLFARWCKDILQSIDFRCPLRTQPAVSPTTSTTLGTTAATAEELELSWLNHDVRTTIISGSEVLRASSACERKTAKQESPAWAQTASLRLVMA